MAPGRHQREITKGLQAHIKSRILHPSLMRATKLHIEMPQQLSSNQLRFRECKAIDVYQLHCSVTNSRNRVVPCLQFTQAISWPQAKWLQNLIRRQACGSPGVGLVQPSLRSELHRVVEEAFTAAHVPLAHRYVRLHIISITI